MWANVKEKLKSWWPAIVAIVAAFFYAGRKPGWVKEKEKEIKERGKEIERVGKEVSDARDDYKEAKDDHDEELKRIKDQKEEYVEPVPFDNPDDAADYLRDIIRGKS